MTKTEILSQFRSSLHDAGYEEKWIRSAYKFADLTESDSQVRQIPLVAFSGYPHTYRNAQMGMLFNDGRPSWNLIHDHRALGAPLLFEINRDRVQAWAVGIDEVKPAGNDFPVLRIKTEFQQKSHIWSAEILGRVKKPSDVNSASQLDLFDTGLVPALERQFQARLKDLLEHAFKEIADCFFRVHGTSAPVSQLFSFLFRFVTAKIFMDRADAKGWDSLATPLEILEKAEAQSGLLDTLPSGFRQQTLLDTAWAEVSRTLHFQNLSVPDLAFVAESTFITNETRDELGVHSTPAGLADYIVNQLPWDEVPVDQRVIFEPFCGHGIFLAKAMERLGVDLGNSLSARSRHTYFRDRLIGVDKDPLSLEVCRLVLTLSDYPNDNSWQLDPSDVFTWGGWDKTLKLASAVLANPPYEAFNAVYRAGIGAKKPNPPAELLRRLMHNPPALLGLVLPKSFISSLSFQDANRSIANRYGVIKLVELPRIFRYANNDTLALIASGLRADGKKTTVHYSEVRKEGIERFLEDFHTCEKRTSDVAIPQNGGPRFTLRLPPKDSIFKGLRTPLKLGDVAEIHKGINWIARVDGKSQSEPREDVASEKNKPGFMLGAEKMSGNLSQFRLSTRRFISLRDHDQDPSTCANKRPWNQRKVVCNAGRFQKGSPWRLAAWADSDGLAFSKQFFAIWPQEGISEFALAAVLSSPLANAFSFEHDLDRDNHIETLRKLPLPGIEYLKSRGELHERAQRLQRLLMLRDFEPTPVPEEVIEALLRCDAVVLDAYGLSSHVQRQVLDSFANYKRPLGAPFHNAFTKYFPTEFKDDITLSDFIKIQYDWIEIVNERRCDLIDKEIKDENLSDNEKDELEHLQHLADLLIRLKDPYPIGELDALITKLKAEEKWVDTI